MNTVIEVAGFLSLDPTVSEDLCHETLESLPPSSVVPHLHAIAVNKLGHCNPLVSSSLNSGGLHRISLWCLMFE